MKSLISWLAFFGTAISVCQVQACFTSEFQRIWDSYAQGELAEEYELYRRFLVDRCQQLSVQWARCCSFRTVQIGIVANSMPQFAGLQMSFFGNIVTFNIGWFMGGRPEYPEVAEVLMSTVRPLIRPDWQIDINDVPFLSQISRPIPCVTLLHELTHLLLRMDFILTHLEWTPEAIRGSNGMFEASYQQWVVIQLLQPIHRDFLASTEDEKIVDRYDHCWGGRDEILVIMGVRLMLEGQAYVLGETMLLRRLAALHGLPTNFVCWSHFLAFFSKNPPAITLAESPDEGLFSATHRTAFIALCHHLGWNDVLPSPQPPLIPTDPRAAAMASLLSPEEEQPAPEPPAPEGIPTFSED
jgi:hypothetical protein